MIGSGIFALSGIVADGLGATAIVAYIFCGALIFLLALCFAEIGSKASKSGGPYNYIEGAFGPYVGFMAASIYIIGSCMASDAALAWLSISSVKKGLRFVMLASIAKLALLIALVTVSVPHVATASLAFIVRPTAGNIRPATLLLFFAFLGFEYRHATVAK